jgi:uncharacterized protein with von Willebrand factor type A (vWA) domain
VLRICRTTLINRKDDLLPLQRLFALLLQMYFSPEELRQSELQVKGQDSVLTVKQQVTLGDTAGVGDDGDDPADIQSYSTIDVDHHKDFRFLAKDDFPAVLKVLEQIARTHAALSRRKSKKAKRGGVIDLRSSIRESIRFDGEIFDWRFKRKIPTHTRLTVVVDVSGSMEVYSVFLLNFLHLLNQNHRLKIEVFVFSTELQPLTQYFRLKNFRRMLDNVSMHFSGWSGGTKIGQAIQSLNDTYAAAVTTKTVVTIMSDGWDTGETDLLDREMAILKRRAKSIVWINPLKGDAAYEPLALGMATARPYCDEFISGHSIAALANFAELVA